MLSVYLFAVDGESVLMPCSLRLIGCWVCRLAELSCRCDESSRVADYHNEYRTAEELFRLPPYFTLKITACLHSLQMHKQHQIKHALV